jgi:NAD(P)-dependent dehydrogenase (short-subunit alcohol dehydrogenase family)
MKEYNPTKKVVIVTGGAGQLGSAFCSEFDRLGNTVVMADLNLEMCESRIKELGLKNAIPLKLDVTDNKNIEEAFAEVVKKFGRIDILINNAGIAVFTPYQTRTFEEFDSVMKVNVYGTFFCAREALKYMEEKETGCIINIASLYGIVSSDPRIYGDSGRNSSEVYGASKAGVIQMTKYLAVHVKSKNIRINSISPGGIFNNQKEFFVKNYKSKTPMDRMANETEIASAAISVCADSNSYLTGQNIVVDGGFSIW